MTTEKNTSATLILVVGRHAPVLPEGYEIVGQENVMFSTEIQDCYEQLKGLLVKAKELDAVLALQNTPTILSAALVQLAKNQVQGTILGIISKPGPRLAGVRKTFDFSWMSSDFGGSYCDVGSLSQVAEELIQFVNPRAKIVKKEEGGFGNNTAKDAVLTIEVDPVTEFILDKVVQVYNM